MIHWFQAYAIDDAIVADAYESADPQGRAFIKQTVACIAAWYGEMPLTVQESRQLRMGTTISVISIPTSSAVFFCPADYAYSQRFAAAVLPAILAGVSTIIPCFYAQPERKHDNKEIDPLLLLTLDLLGVEQGFYLPTHAINDAFKIFAAERARVVSVADVPLLESGIPAAQFAALGGIHLCHTDKSGKKSCDTGLTLDAACAEMWMWPQLSPSWFREQRISLQGTV